MFSEMLCDIIEDLSTNHYERRENKTETTSSHSLSIFDYYDDHNTYGVLQDHNHHSNRKKK